MSDVDVIVIESTAMMESPNDCWFCKFTNMSHVETCERCGAAHAPSQPFHKVRSFGQRAETLNCKLHSSWLADAVQAFRTTVHEAVRVGVAGNRAIIVKDANGSIRTTIRVDPNTQTLLTTTNDPVTDFFNTAQIILQNDPNPNTGKITHKVIHYI